MEPVIISCLSQKGGVGKSTLSRMIAVGYASNDWSVKIADFNTTQLTSFKWNEKRKAAQYEPAIDAKPYAKPSMLSKERVDLVVADGKPDSHDTSLDIALASRLILIPTAPIADDVEPQLAFALELVDKGAKKDDILFVISKSVDSAIAVKETRELISGGGFKIAKTEIKFRPTYAFANSTGLAVQEVKVATLKRDAKRLLTEIYKLVDERTGV
ncbi:chromosome partitioning protein [Ochrobactrum sp. P20RRXII]|nr:division plane positioning ATPase MipZ [Ochrobactrum sp. P20RRXII]NIH77408.1 chromosome partitioning protein [Ochrobactrum sp. P20RRXII]